MGKTKNKKTFAERANAITLRYKGRLGKDLKGNDPIARESMELELEALKQEQEQYKIDNGLNNQENPVFRKGGKLPQYQGIGRSQIVGGGLNQDGVIDYGQELGLSPFLAPEQASVLNEKFIDPYNPEDDMAFALNSNNFKIPQINAAQANLEGTPQLQPELYSPGFNYVGAGASVLSGIHNYLNTPDTNIDKIQAERMSPQKISLAEDRIAARSRSQQSKNRIARVAKGIGSNSADYINRVISGQTSADRLEGEQVSRSLMQEQSANAQAINRARMFNIQNKLRADTINLQNQAQVDEAKRLQRQNAVTGIGQGLTQAYADYQGQQDLYNALQLQSPYYSIYKDPQTGKPIIGLDENKNRRTD